MPAWEPHVRERELLRMGERQQGSDRSEGLKDLSGAQTPRAVGCDREIQVGSVRPAAEPATQSDETQNDAQSDGGNQGLSGAQTQAYADGDKEKGQFLGLFDRGTKPHDRKRTYQTQRQRER